MKKIMFVFGTRPEFIKMFPVIKLFQEEKNLYNVIIVNTGQHKEMLNSIMSNFKILENYNLNVMEKSNGLSEILSNSITGIDKVIKIETPDLIFVHGDTSATLAGSIAAFYNQIKLAHIEAGLRTFDKYSPFPEEMNRQLTGIMADFHFTPTNTTMKYLKDEGKNEKKIYMVGNSAIDMMKYTIKSDFTHPLLDYTKNKNIILVTAHRRENIEDLENIFEAFNEIAESNPKYVILYPIHLNPIIRNTASRIIKSKNVKIIDPLDTVDFHNIMSKAKIILTDSGGIQEEAPSLGIPVLVMRDTTERPEGVEAGTLKLIGTQKERIIEETQHLIDNTILYDSMATSKNPYGDGNTSERIMNIINEFFRNGN